jgi:hypothetical protein
MSFSRRELYEGIRRIHGHISEEKTAVREGLKEKNKRKTITAPADPKDIQRS